MQRQLFYYVPAMDSWNLNEKAQTNKTISISTRAAGRQRGGEISINLTKYEQRTVWGKTMSLTKEILKVSK